MYKIRTSIDDKIQANNIAHKLVAEHGAVSVHIREVNSVYQWQGQIEDIIEYEIEALVSNPQDANEIISKYHTYKLPEFIITDIVGTNDIENWCDDWCSKHKTSIVKQYYSIKEFAELIGVSQNSLRLWDKNGKLKPHHLTTGGHRVYSYEQAQKYMKGQ